MPIMDETRRAVVPDAPVSDYRQATNNMRLRHQVIRAACVGLCTAALFAAPAGACTTPVFRYALERWEPDIYGVLVFHDGPLTAEQKKALTVLTDAAANQDKPCNMEVLPVDVSGEIPKYVQEVWKEHKGEDLPKIVACFPRRYGPIVCAWSGPLTSGNAKALVESPLRTQIYRQIISGATAVWVLLETGDAAKDAAAAKVLTTHLKTMESEMQLPPQPPSPFGEEEQVGPPLKIAFPLVRVSRKAPAERIVLDMLLNTEEDLRKEYAGEPMAFAFFGQGRAMWALVGKGINEENIIDVCAFLVGRCSCQVKAQNPGVDMPFAVDWYAAFEEGGAMTAVLPGVVIAPDTQPTTQATQPADEPLAAGPFVGPTGGSSLLRNVLIALGGVGLLAAALVVWAGRRKTVRA